ncbi:ankyrin repeat domain-containing protein 50-like [Lytechinus variegatus]|uniref:ankyrin repeat domain-containing protein 50-like n=1 Tax=Lytechinus variegatus TaxID=7654 RepID=UPI001BB1376A|nr:ankyrin repeat domain-containing protein 50-like [Lytechinus variegatus]
MSALHAAARTGNIDIVKYLIQHGSNVNKTHKNGLTPLIASIIEGHLEVVEFLMAKGAKCVSTESISPLYIAAQYNHVEVVKFLVSKGYNVNERTESGKSPLHAACYNGNIDMVDFLLLNIADVNIQDQDGWTPLQAAAQKGHLQVVKYLSVRGANMKDMDGITSNKASPNKDHSTRRIKGRCCTGVFAQIATRDQQYKIHQNAITAEDATASSTDPQVQSCTTHTEQSELQVHNIHDENEFIHAEIEEESWD